MNLLKTVWKKWVPLAHKIGNFQARLVLTLFYFILLLPFSLMVTLFSDRLKKKKPKNSMWTPWVEGYQTLEEGKSQY